ncbi:capsid protein VP1, partial [cosavirus A17]
LGLQSTINFVIPFISASDFRYNDVSVASALNSDGWFTVWLLNPLTYPPGTPPTQQIVMMLSAGSDFSYRLPISPGMAQTDGASGPHDNVECGVTDDADASLNSGHSVSLPTPHTHVDFFFDRYRYAGPLRSNARNGPKPVSYLDDAGKVKNMPEIFGTTNDRKPYTVCALSPYPSICGVAISSFMYGKSAASKKIIKLMAGDDLMYKSCPFTYYKCDLEFTVVPPLGHDRDYTVHWYPPGATLDQAEVMYGMSAGNSNFDDNGENHGSAIFSVNPAFYARGPCKVSAVIPFCAPTTLLPLY